MIPHLDWIAGASTLVSTQLIAMKYWQGWVLKIVNCGLWVYLMYHAGYYALKGAPMEFLNFLMVVGFVVICAGLNFRKQT